MGGLVIDFILAAVAIVMIAIYTKKGFVGSVLGFFSFWIALLFAFLTSKLITAPIERAINGKIEFMSSESAAKVMAFALMLVIGIVLVKVLTFILARLISKLPLIRTADKLLGFCVGVIIAVFWVQILSIIFTVFGGYLANAADFINDDAFEKSFITSFLYEHNIFKALFNLI